LTRSRRAGVASCLTPQSEGRELHPHYTRPKRMCCC